MITHNGRDYKEMPAAVPDGMKGGVNSACRLPAGSSCPTAGMCYGTGIVTCFYARPPNWFTESVRVGEREEKATLPTDAAARKAIPLASGCLDYFPDALIAIAELSRKGNDQHNPGQPLHWDRSKSGDEADADIRHFMERGKMDTDGVRHSTKHAWRALALLQKELEAAGAPMARGTK
jgi:hypothetical protein